MKPLSKKSEAIFNRLSKKANSSFSDKTRIPSLKHIAFLLDELKIPYELEGTYNVVEHRSAGRRYVNSRHRGKEGYELIVKENNDNTLHMDTSDSYYSWNTDSYAQRLIALIKGK